MSVFSLESPDVTLETAGGKGLNLARLTRAGFAVPRGFIISTEAYQAFVEANRWLSFIGSAGEPLPIEDVSALEKRSAQIRAAFTLGAMPEEVESAIRAAYREFPGTPVAVRSSATAEDLPDLSFAGQQDTYLNVTGEEELLKAVVSCWSSLWTARAIGYRLRNRIPQEDVALAVIVQEMIPSEVSGVMFTANPLTGLRSETVIDATFGLGEALVSGQVEPDHYVVDAPGNRIVGKRLGSKEISTRSRSGGGVETKHEDLSAQQALADEQVLQLAELGRSIQQEYGFPQDVEWAFAARKLYVLQARPITSLYPIPEESLDPLKAWFSFGAVQGMLQPLTPLGQDSVLLVLAGAAALFGFRLNHETIDFARVAGERLWIRIDGLVRNPIGGRISQKLLPMVEPGAAAVLVKLANDPRFKQASGGVKFDSLRRVLVFFLPLLPRFVYTMLWPERARDEFEDHLARTSSLAKVSQDGDMYGRLADCVVLLRDQSTIRAFELIMPRFLPIFAPGMAALNFLTSLAGQKDGGEHGISPLALEVTRGLPRNVTTEMDLALWETAKAIRSDPVSLERFTSASPSELAADYLSGSLPVTAEQSLVGFMERYGMRAIGEIDLGQPRWRERPEPVMQTLQSYLKIGEDQAPDILFARGEQRARVAIEKLANDARALPGGWLREKLVRAAARRVRALTGAREAPKFYAIRVMGVVRAELLKLGEEFAKAGIIEKSDDLFFLHIRELDALAHRQYGDWKTLISGRRAVYERESRRRQIPRLLVSDGRAFYEGLGSEMDDGDIITGSPVSPGVVEGVVHVVFDPHESQLAPGEILVCPGTDPAWTPLFLSAGGLITEVGGMMTHGSVVAREYGIPAVVGVHRATTRLQTGQRIRLDGTAGKIMIL